MANRAKHVKDTDLLQNSHDASYFAASFMVTKASVT
jgi:hypothetical protein